MYIVIKSRRLWLVVTMKLAVCRQTMGVRHSVLCSVAARWRGAEKTECRLASLSPRHRVRPQSDERRHHPRQEGTRHTRYNAFLKRSFKYGFCTDIYTVELLAQEADRLDCYLPRWLVINIASTFCCLILNRVIIALDQRTMLISCPDVNTNCIRDHLYRGVFLVMCSF